jgi:hypothetical protein
MLKTLKGLGLCAANPYRVHMDFNGPDPGLELRSNPGLELANAFGVLDHDPSSICVLDH